MTVVNLFDIKTELVVFLRNKDIFSITERGVTTTTDSYVATGGQTDFTLTNLTVKNVRSVEVNSTPLIFGKEYSVNYTTGVVTLATGATASDDVDIEYDYGNSDKIFPDYPDTAIKTHKLPRIGFDVISSVTEETELGAGSNSTRYRIQINNYDEDNENLEIIASSIKNSILINKKNFYNFCFVTHKGFGPAIPPTWGGNKVLQRSQDLEVWSLNETGE
jgi:hypothetical protein